MTCTHNVTVKACVYIWLFNHLSCASPGIRANLATRLDPNMKTVLSVQRTLYSLLYSIKYVLQHTEQCTLYTVQPALHFSVQFSPILKDQRRPSQLQTRDAASISGQSMPSVYLRQDWVNYIPRWDPKIAGQHRISHWQLPQPLYRINISTCIYAPCFLTTFIFPENTIVDTSFHISISLIGP